MELKLEAEKYDLPGEAARLEEDVARGQARYRKLTNLLAELEAAYDVTTNPLERAGLEADLTRIKAERAQLNLELLDWEKRHRELRPSPQREALDATDSKDGAWGLCRIGAVRVWEEFEVRGEGAIVAVLGTGVDPTVPGLQQRLAGYRPHPTAPSRGPEDPFGSGTQLASTIVGGVDSNGVPVGVAPAARLLIANLFGRSGEGTETDVVLAMQWAVEQGADVILLAIGAPIADWRLIAARLDRAALNCLALGVTVVAPAGNGGSGIVTFPGNAEHVLAVGALGPGDRIAAFSGGAVLDPSEHDADLPSRITARYVKPDLCAPGINVPVINPGGNSSRTSGTMVAAAQVAGVLALMTSASRSQPTDRAISGRLFNDVIESVDTLGEIGKDARFGEGVVNAHRAVARILGKAPA